MKASDWIFLTSLSGIVVADLPGVKKWFGEFAVDVATRMLEKKQQPEAQKGLPPPTPHMVLDYTDGVVKFITGNSAEKAEKNELPHPPGQLYAPAVDEPLAHLVRHPSIILILGHRGNGKTGLAIRLQELLRDVAAPYAIGLPAKASRLFPSWYGLSEDFDTIPNDAVIYVPESYRLFHSRETQSAQGRVVAELVNLSRHRKHTLIFDVQNAAHLDRNIVSEVDLVLVKEPGPFQEGFKRTQFLGVMNNARAAFAGIGRNRKKRAVWVVAPTAGINGQLMENQLPTFWNDSISRVFGDTAASLRGAPGSAPNDGKVGEPNLHRRGQRTPTAVKREKAKQMQANGYSYGEIAAALGISRSYAHKLVNGSG